MKRAVWVLSFILACILIYFIILGVSNSRTRDRTRVIIAESWETAKAEESDIPRKTRAILYTVKETDIENGDISYAMVALQSWTGIIDTYDIYDEGLSVTFTDGNTIYYSRDTQDWSK